jgi:hypothetical protein
MSNSVSPFRRPFFLMLVHKKEGKEQDTPASACILRYSTCRASIETRPDKPHTSWLVAELGQPMAENSRQACVARRGRWGTRKPSEHYRLAGLTKRIWFFNRPN